ncbi:hypothetical protein PSCLAVI8L_110045 [Pseudoclavibacter sp. 8L]|nr:hypothetical protein PSCLAVI8L_110045 [Pseudoclavibacter sp. 8L]
MPFVTASLTASGSRRQRTSKTERAISKSTDLTTAPRYSIIETRPRPANVFSASRTGVLDTPKLAASSDSTRGCPARSAPERIDFLSDSTTCPVRDNGVAIGANGSKLMWPSFEMDTSTI